MMKKLLNTLYIVKQNSYLAKEGTNVLVRFENETLFRLPLHTLSSIVCFGQIGVSPALMHLCGEHGVTLTFLSEQGRFLARVEGPVKGNILLRMEQYKSSSDLNASAKIARSIVTAKVVNSRSVLLRAARERNDLTNDLSKVAEEMDTLLGKVALNNSLDEVRGFEGNAARLYFGVFDHLILAQKDSFKFQGRNRRPPLDAVNALLSFLYTLLVSDARAALETVGLDPQAGFLHRTRPGRPSLALDLMEELRAPLVDRLALTLINRQQVRKEGFSISQNGEVSMDDSTRKEVLSAWQNRKRDEIRHPFLEETIDVGMIVHAQALLMARHLRGDIDTYPPMIWK